MNNKVASHVGLGLSTLPVLFLIFEIVIKLLEIQPVKDSMAQLG